MSLASVNSLQVYSDNLTWSWACHQALGRLRRAASQLQAKNVVYSNTLSHTQKHHDFPTHRKFTYVLNFKDEFDTGSFSAGAALALRMHKPQTSTCSAALVPNKNFCTAEEKILPVSITIIHF